MADILPTLRNELEEFGVVAAEDVLLKMQELCIVYGKKPDDMVTSWIAFSASKLIGMELTLAYLSQFEKEELMKTDKVSKSRKSHGKKSSTPMIYDSSTIDYLDAGEASSEVNENRVPSHIRSPAVSSFSPSILASQATPSARYGSRKASGDVVCTFGNTEQGSWDIPGQLTIKLTHYDEELELTAPYTYMFEKFRDYASVLNDMIEDAAEKFKNAYEVDQWSPVHLPAMEPVSVIGRVCSDDGSKLTMQSLLLEGSHETSSGQVIPLDVSQLEKFSLFPGKIIAGQGINSVGKKFVLQTLYEDIILPFRKEAPNIEEGLKVVVAAGPFTTTDSLSFEPLTDLLKYLRSSKPHICFLIGPFLDAKNEEIKKGKLSETYESIFEGLIRMIMSNLDDISVVLVSSSLDLHHEPVYPTPPYDIKMNFKNLYLASDPCVLNINGIIFAVTSTDVLFHLGKEEINLSPQGSDRLGRLCTHLLTQRNFYPLYPPADGVNIDFIHYEAHCSLPIMPHVLVMPSDLRYFMKNINGCLCINPERLTKTYVGGTFMRMKINPINPSSYSGSVADQIYAEVIKI